MSRAVYRSVAWSAHLLCHRAQSRCGQIDIPVSSLPSADPTQETFSYPMGITLPADLAARQDIYASIPPSFFALHRPYTMETQTQTTADSTPRKQHPGHSSHDEKEPSRSENPYVDKERSDVASGPAVLPPDPRRSFTKDVILICTVTLAMILNIANSTAVIIALPTIGKELNIVEYKLQWIISAYSLSSGCLLLFLGRIADLYSRKWMFIFGCAFMGIFSLGCGFAQDEITLDVLRGVQGIGAAACIPAALGILAEHFPPSPLRSVAFATFAAGAPVGAALGVALGGILTQLTKQTWRSTFWLLAALTAPCCIGAMLSIEGDFPRPVTDRRVDWIGAVLVTAGLTFIIFVLSDGSIAPDGWKTAYIIALLIVGVFLLVLFVLWQHYLEQQQNRPELAPKTWWNPPPLMSVTVWTRARGKLAVVLGIAFLQWCGFQAFAFWIQLYYQDYLGLNPLLTMVRVLPMCVAGAACNLIVAIVVGRIPLIYLIVTGTVLTAVASLLFAVIDTAATYWAFGFPAAILSVCGTDFVFSTGTLFVAKVCLPHEQSVGGALFQTLTQVGTAFGIAISTIVFNATLSKSSIQYGVHVNKEGTNAPRPAQLVAYRDAFWTATAFAFAGVVLALLFLRSVGVVGERRKKQDAISETTCVAEEA
ncbi:MFS general substrate transporter [Trametes sanguinea]|nr:MFS general substrate transporter [Trametes sanguinea]